MTEFACPYCPKTYKTERGLNNHLRNIHGYMQADEGFRVKPGPEATPHGESMANHGLSEAEPRSPEVTPESDPGEVYTDLSEPSPAPENTLREPEGLSEAESGERSEPSPEEFGAWLVKQITVLGENQERLSEEVRAMRKNEYQATQLAEGVNPGLQWSFEEFPEWLKKPAVKFLGDLGAAARAFAGGGQEDSDLEMLKEVIALDREATRERRRTRITTIMGAMTDPDSQLYSIKPKKKKDPKISKDEATPLG